MSSEEAKEWDGKSKPRMPIWNGPNDIRRDFIQTFGIDFTSSYVDPSNWIEATKTIVPYTHTGGDMLKRRCREFCRERGISVSDRRVLDG